MNSLGSMSTFHRSKAALALFVGVALTASAWAADRSPGLAVTFGAGNASDSAAWPGVQLFVPAGQSASPFLPAGPFTATWQGFVNSELRSEYVFHAEAAGDVTVEVNGNAALTGASDGSKPLSSAAVKLNKGANAFRVLFKSPAQGDAFLRIYWSNAETPRNPIPLSALSHDDSESLKSSQLIQEGRHLFAEFRCVRCHDAGKGTHMPELDMDAPSLQGVGSRLGEAWMAQWIADPAAQRPGTPMPRVLHGATAAEDAGALAAYLASLKGAATASLPGKVEDGKALYEKLLCASCHNPPDGKESDPAKVSQKHVKQKYQPGALAEFLGKPSAHFAWIRMPDFRLTPDEAGHLAAFLNQHADGEVPVAKPSDPARIERGRKLAAIAGCVNCHALEGLEKTPSKPLSELAADRWNSGCLADAPAPASKAPVFAFSSRQRDALRAFARTDRKSLDRHVASEFIGRQAEALRCAECHGKHEGFPTWELLGGKLKPEWATAFIAGRIETKPRPWLEARMPAFPAYAAGLAEGLATRHGWPAKTPADAPAKPEDAEKGRKLVSANGGFSCVACHSVADFGATAVFEAPGINLALSFDRLQPDYFRRWLRSPLSVDPNTKMPVYFDEQGKSPLADFYDGDGPKTIHAVWEYLKAGKSMPKPE